MTKNTTFRLLVLFLSIYSFGNLQAKELNILFIGNSFTFRHNLPTLVKEIIEEGQKGTTVNVERVVFGGQDLYRHYTYYFSEAYLRMDSISVSEIEDRIKLIKKQQQISSAPSEYTNYWKDAALRMMPWAEVLKNLKQSAMRLERLAKRVKAKDTKKWDYIVLQSWNDIVPDLDKAYGKYVQKLSSIAAKQNTKVILYLSSPHSQNKVPVTKPFGLKRTKAELKIASQLSKKVNAAAVVPVPLAIWKLQEKGSSILLRYKSDFHPNQYTAYLTANMFYAALFKQSTEGFKFNSVTETRLDNGKDPDGGDATVIFKGKVQKAIQKASFDAIVDFDKGSF